MADGPSKKLLNGCVQILAKFAEKIHYPINLEQEDNYFALKCKSPIPFSERQNVYQLIGLKEIKNIGIHFALKFEIEPIKNRGKVKTNYKLTDANLKFVFLNDSNSNVLFRSEFASNKDKIHAQPHWQFEPYIIKAISNEDVNTFIEIRNEEKELLDFNDEIDTAFNISKIHFAMISDWHLPRKDQDDNFFATQINETNVVTWLEGCLNYTVNQIKR